MKSLFSTSNQHSVALATNASEDSHSEHEPASGANRSATPVQNASPLRALSDEPQVMAKTRHQSSRKYNLKILHQADSCQDGGQVNALLSREGLCSPNLLLRREKRKRGIFTSLTPRKREGQLAVHSQLTRENEQLKLQNQRLSKRLGEAELISEFQKKLAEALEFLLKNRE